ncbi:MAG: hypothetical protein EOO02_09785 [Chitinophagaceae bacterium]|nr:MAG: hypothetical protein EOO02_09785 [Chitinophagaceae bacterium]
MNNQLALYKDDERVVSIGSWNYYHPSTSNFFLRVTDSIAWGVYGRSWKDFEPDSIKLLAEIEKRNLIKKFDFDGAYEFSKMLKAQSEGKVDSWAIRWYATNFLKDGLCLYPGLSLTKHIGNVKGAAHSDDPEDIYRQTFDVTNHQPGKQKIKIEESARAVRSYMEFHQIPGNSKMSILSKIKSLFR